MQQKLSVQMWTHLALKKQNQCQDIGETVENQENIWILQQLLSQLSKLHLLQPAHRSPAVLSDSSICSLHSSHRAICTHSYSPQRPCSRLSLTLSAQRGGDFQWLQSHCDNPLGQLKNVPSDCPSFTCEKITAYISSLSYLHLPLTVLLAHNGSRSWQYHCKCDFFKRPRMSCESFSMQKPVRSNAQPSSTWAVGFSHPPTGTMWYHWSPRAETIQTMIMATNCLCMLSLGPASCTFNTRWTLNVPSFAAVSELNTTPVLDTT